MLRREMMKSWVAVRSWKTNYFIASSVFNPGSRMIVTICVVFMAAKVACRSSLLHLNSGSNLIFYLQCIFILVAWILMLTRWFKAVLYCGASLQKYFILSFRPAAVAVYLLNPRLVYTLSIQEFKLRNILISVSCVVPLLPLCVLILAVTLLGLFCFISWYSSDLVCGRKFVQKICTLDEKSVSADEKYCKFQEFMSHDLSIEEEISHTFWIVNKKSFIRIKGSMKEGNAIGQSCTGLFSIMRNARLAENQRLRLQLFPEFDKDLMGVV
ncbi:hypothetical protein SUGI_0226410 [Cryptomeria japonica]|nr:hypothetical protein SUGI_0226410 [Cryptomeria japonica]